MDPMALALSKDELLTAWRTSLRDIVALCAPLSEEQWNAPTPCPGWSVADVAAHVADIEQVLLEDPRPEHVPDWAELPHVTGPVGQFIEVGVDFRRGRSKDEVLAEIASNAARRAADLEPLPPDATVRGVRGNEVALERLLRVRTFDVWAHGQDIRSALSLAGDLDSVPAIVAFQQIAAALPAIWAKEVGAPEGSTVQVTVTGPGPESDLYAHADGADGQSCGPLDEPTVHVTLTWPDYMRLSCGRIDPADAPILITGDASLAAALVGALTITP